MSFVMLLWCCLAVELVCGNIYCWECRDYIYDSRIDAVMKEVEQMLRGRQVSGKLICSYVHSIDIYTKYNRTAHSIHMLNTGYTIYYSNYCNSFESEQSRVEVMSQIKIVIFSSIWCIKMQHYNLPVEYTYPVSTRKPFITCYTLHKMIKKCIFI